MGLGQIDTLTGGEGEDIFVLGDNRGVFYDDRNSKNVGTSDYALINDFNSQADSLLVYGAVESYIFVQSGNDVLLYFDQNGSGNIETRGRSKDELIAVLADLGSTSSGQLQLAGLTI